ncbi:MAG: hypothetical protein EOP87_16710 [Verrucomicrobiaceae bacterium]|nr:MAG: hypothetical protein EOP87_16710 [Verrucomicrobiaceae bacterium]
MPGRRDFSLSVVLAATTSRAAFGVSAPANLDSAGYGTFDVGIELSSLKSLHACNPLLAGSNTPWIHGSEGLLDQQGRWREPMLSRAREWSPSILRYMAGEPVIGFDWRHGMGAMAQRPWVRPDLSQPMQPIRFGTGEFLALCAQLQAIPLIQMKSVRSSSHAQ